ncbi:MULTISPECIES: tyrosine-type recombinase/integrase [unclassified Nocardioides]|uniref:tyrosine-type recombinase/integrase n=1 Tax=unclassified Nocardioides TaxID=2615069 RepID=UPI0006FA4F38|nr:MULTISPECIES: tyrosine-type recombinase/integrase [unclassified Nocardioides]KQY56234.1 integrase [Nocardioides sp. Root140]KQZ75018.1 integrase [Nocardioides sp. Root151]KRF10553.1 integrase [Nocardioides sp. Soil796]
MTSLAPLLQAFFTDRLMTQRRASPHTIAAYRDTFRLLLEYTTAQTGTAPSALQISDLDAPCISGFLTHLQQVRGNTVRTRNARLAAIHSLFGYAALRHPEHAAVIQRVLAIPSARIERNLVNYLDHAEADALLQACDQTTRTGRRDHAMFALAIQTGLRISELIGLTVADIHLGTGPHVHCVGKGRKERRTPILAGTVAVMRPWLTERNGHPDDPLFTTTAGRPLSRDAIERRIRLAATRAQAVCPSLAGKRVTAHTLRHSAAMRLLHAGVDTTVIALWLGHEQITTTNIYLHADMTIKENAIAKITPQSVTAGRYQPSDPVLAFLANL